MNSKEYIGSGILETYVLGIATPEEAKQVEQMASQYPEVKAELEKIEQAIGAYAQMHSIAPRADLKEKIMDAVLNESSGSGKIVDFNGGASSSIRFIRIFAIAASIALLISASFNFSLYNKLKDADQQLAVLNSEKEVLANSAKGFKASYQQSLHEIHLLHHTQHKAPIELNGLDPAPDAKVLVYWDKETNGGCCVEVVNMPVAPTEMEYQFWAIVDGKPVDMGLLGAGDSLGAKVMKDVANAQAFAITLETKGGHPQPEGKMYVMANVPAQAI